MIEINLVPAFLPFYQEPRRYKFAYGGRGGSKSWAFADILLVKGREQKLRILCTREIQKSIKDSVHTLLKDRIAYYGFTDYEVLANEIRNTNSDTDFIFTGLREHNVNSIKSYEGVDICWVEEGQGVTQPSWDILTPTIRKPGSEIWVSYNRFTEADPCHSLCMAEVEDTKKMAYIYKDNEFVWRELRGDYAIGVNINYDGNPYFPKDLLHEMERDKNEDFDLYLHKWLGEPINQSDDALIDRVSVMNAMSRTVNAWNNPHIGIDPARYGDDETVICYRIGDRVFPFKTYKKKDLVTVSGAVLDTVREMRENKTVDPNTPIKIKVDDTGIGAGVTDMLQKHARHYTDLKMIVYPIVNNGKVDNKRYKDKGAAMWGCMKERLKDIQLPDDMELLSQLTTRKYVVEMDGSIRLERKKDMKKRGIHSPDRADALALCLYEHHQAPLEVDKAVVKPITAGLRGKKW
jgi:phage terminase large subunit